MKILKAASKSLPVLIAVLFLFSCQIQDTSQKVRPFELDEITIPEIQQAYKDGKYTIHQVVQLYVDRIKEIDRNGPKLNAIIVVNPDALQIADSPEKVMAAGGNHGPMFGIPVVLKDNIDTHDKMPTTAGSRVLKDSYPDRDSFVAKKLRQAGAVILAKANLSEWANYRAWSEPLLIEIANAYEQGTKHRKAPEFLETD